MISFTSDNDLSSLDPKILINFFDSDLEKTELEINSNNINDQIIWTIDNFLTKDQCERIIEKSENKLENKFENKGSRKRLIAFEENGYLLNSIQTKLKSVIDNMDNICEPYGFYKGNWKMNGNINQCLRINKYDINDYFNWHRDSQFTESKYSRSNYTLIIYLNDDFEEGSTIFKIPKKEIIHNGLTVLEEINNNEFTDFEVKPKTGKAVIFDQRLLHKGNITNGIKYVFRTDILTYCDTIEENSELVNKIETLTKNLFRQAQLMELEDKHNKNNNLQNQTTINDLYDIVLSLRQNPFILTEVPIHLNKYLTIINETKENDKENKIFFKKRTSNKYFFTHNKVNTIDALIVSSLYTIYYSNKYLKNPNEYLKKHLENFKITLQENQIKEIKEIKENIETKEDHEDINSPEFYWKYKNNYKNKFKKIGYNSDLDFLYNFEYYYENVNNRINLHTDDKNSLILLIGDKIRRFSVCSNSLSGCGCENASDEILYNIDFKINEKFNSTFIINEINYKYDSLVGKIKFNLPCSSYNHASCNYFYYDIDDSVPLIKIKHNIDVIVSFKITKNKIITELELGIVL